MSPFARTPRKPREVVLQILYQDDLNPAADSAWADLFMRRRLNDDEPQVAFASALLAGVRQRREELDGLLAGRADNWSLNRMAATDRNILRLGAYEILFTETPDRVAINEAVELAKRFGAKQSAQFVNGVLDRFLQKPRIDELVEAESEPPATSKPAEIATRIPSAEEFARALSAVSERPAERKFPAFYRTLLKTHADSGAQAAAELAEAMGWENGGVVLARYEELGKRLGDELHFDPPLYDAVGEPLWISVLAKRAEEGDHAPENRRWMLRDEIVSALRSLGWV